MPETGLTRPHPTPQGRLLGCRTPIRAPGLPPGTPKGGATAHQGCHLGLGGVEPDKDEGLDGQGEHGKADEVETEELDGRRAR